MIRTCRQPESLRWPLLAALFLVLQAWAEMTYASFLVIFGALLVAFFAARRLVTSRATCPQTPAKQSSVRWWIDLARDLMFLGALFVLGIAPALLAAMLPDMLAEGDFWWVEGTGFAETFSADILGFLLPTKLNPWFGHAVSQSGILAFDKGQHIFIGLTLLAMTAIGIWFGFGKDRRRTGANVVFWSVSAFLFGWLCLGTSAHFDGADTGVPWTFFRSCKAFHFFKGNRYPSRFQRVPDALTGNIGGGRGGGSPEAIGSENTGFLPPDDRCGRVVGSVFPGRAPGNSAPYVQYGSAGGCMERWPPPGVEGTLLDIPFAWRNGFRVTGTVHTGLHVRASSTRRSHQRPMVQGNTSRNPEAIFQYFTQAPILNSLLALETGHILPAGREDHDKQLAGDVLRFLDVTTIVVRTGAEVSVPPAVVARGGPALC